MNVRAEKISDSELDVMKVLWEAGDAVSITYIREKLQDRKDWEATTVKTLVGRLVSKGAVLQEKRNVFYYTPLITEKEYNDWALQHMIHRLYKGSAKNLVASLVNSDGLSADDLEELRAMFSVEG